MKYIIKQTAQATPLMRMANMQNTQSTQELPTVYQIFKEVTSTDPATGDSVTNHQLVETLDADAFAAIQGFTPVVATPVAPIEKIN